LSVFKGRAGDPERDTAIERCDVSVEDGEGKAKSRFVVRIICRHGKINNPTLTTVPLMFIGVIKTYRLTFESIAPMHAFFDKEIANNSWSISSRTLREFVEHFGPGTEQLDIYSENGRVSLTSYTEKIMSGNGMVFNKKTEHSY
jgi:cell cycle checkpoint control protein RAD9A